jgi:hypothetical protein
MSKKGVNGYVEWIITRLDMVPSRGWKLVNYGQPPVPKCSLIVRCLEDA